MTHLPLMFIASGLAFLALCMHPDEVTTPLAANDQAIETHAPIGVARFLQSPPVRVAPPVQESAAQTTAAESEVADLNDNEIENRLTPEQESATAAESEVVGLNDNEIENRLRTVCKEASLWSNRSVLLPFSSGHRGAFFQLHRPLL